MEKFSVLERKLLQSLRAEAGRRPKTKIQNPDFLQKKFEFRSGAATIFKKTAYSSAVFRFR
jgi:hypothetical protein